jgi:hypothetical protein
MVQTAQGPDHIPCIGADAELRHAPDINGYLHGSDLTINGGADAEFPIIGNCLGPQFRLCLGPALRIERERFGQFQYLLADLP